MAKPKEPTEKPETVHYPAWDTDRRVFVFSDADYAAIGVASPRVS